MAALRVGDRVLYDGKRWHVDALGLDAVYRLANKTVVDGELHAILVLEVERPGSQPPYKVVVPESRWDEVRLLDV
jgi:hypothetical protein